MAWMGAPMYAGCLWLQRGFGNPALSSIRRMMTIQILMVSPVYALKTRRPGPRGWASHRKSLQGSMIAFTRPTVVTSRISGYIAWKCQ